MRPSDNRTQNAMIVRTYHLLERWGFTGIRLLVAQLKADPTFDSEEERVRAFVARGGGCRATYFNHARTLGCKAVVPRIVLSNSPPHLLTPDTETQLLDLLRSRFGRLGNG